MIYDVIQSLVVLTEKLAIFSKQLQGVYCILNINESVNKVNIGQESVVFRKLIIDRMQKKRPYTFK